MAAVVGGQVEAVGLVVGGQDDAADVEDRVFADVLLVDAQHVGRRGRERLHVVVEGEAVDLAEIARLGNAQDHRLQEAVEAAEQLQRRDLGEVPRADRVLDRLEQRVLADALAAAEHQRVVDLLAGELDAMGQPADQVVALVADRACSTWSTQLLASPGRARSDGGR